MTSMEDNNRMHEWLQSIIAEAQRIGIELFSCPYDVRFHFPELNESYDPTVMVNLDPSLKVNLLHARVGMSVTPYIRLSLTNYEPARMRIVCSAKVFTGVPGEMTTPQCSSGSSS